METGCNFEKIRGNRAEIGCKYAPPSRINPKGGAKITKYFFLAKNDSNYTIFILF